MIPNRPWKVFVVLCFGVVFFCFNKPGFCMPQVDFTLYGRAMVEGKELTRSDTNYTITLEVNGVELVRYAMGSSASYEDFYVLKVPMDSDPQVSNKAYMGDTADVFINGQAVSENPVAIGNPGDTVLLDITIP